MKKKRKPARSFRAMAWRIIAPALAGWMIVMAVLTCGVATDMARQMETNTQEFADTILPWYNDEDNLPGTLEREMISDLSLVYALSGLDQLWPFVLPGMPDHFGSDDWIWGKWDILYGYEAAIAFRMEGETVIASGSYLDFSYQTEEQWKAGSDERVGIAYIDLNAFEEGRALADEWIGGNPMGELMMDYFFAILRLTGYFEGNEFHPVKIDKIHRAFLPEYLPNDRENYGQYDQRVGLDWENILDLEPPADRELVTIYGFGADAYHYPLEDPVTVDGVEYENLLALLESENWYREKNSLFESVYTWGTAHDTPEGEVVTSVIVRCWPLQYAALRMIPAYLVSFAVLSLVLFLLLRRIKWDLTQPLERLAEAAQRNQPLSPFGPTADWAEPRALEEYYQTSRQALHEANTRVAQMETALEYAKNAEESRRQLVSNITHELKTPLAVIHSYAEGLQAGIAGEKKDQYLHVILEETEKMDAMVLQMLDLSRLEAGRVRLASDSVSLLALSKAVVEKLTPLAESRDVALCFDFAEEFTVTADEARMEQAITNLVSNAVKYADPGTQVRLKVYTHRGSAWFYIENVCPHLSEEALEKVWDSFYRADAARRSPGTGLGLTIVKTIVELHRGTCTVRNTTRQGEAGEETCVQFGFRLPLA